MMSASSGFLTEKHALHQTRGLLIEPQCMIGNGSSTCVPTPPQQWQSWITYTIVGCVAAVLLLVCCLFVVVRSQRNRQWSWRLKKEYDQFDPYGSRRSSMESRQRKVTNPIYEGQGPSTAYELNDAGLTDFEESGLTELQVGGLTDTEDGGSTDFHSDGGSTELQDVGSTGFEEGVLTEFQDLDLTEGEESQDGMC
ncbi:Hypp3227 [Branchiostoma lanceolatum]|uniref:Hypp3227 protein n=1 Tax=Branchiostoma lanceolatum TaxID=7740 RepID=A0A8K0EWD9_BRALA|nr:Hypp3227 [Branchiostoma lanceolatum]